MRAKPVAVPEDIRRVLEDYLGECAQSGEAPASHTYQFYRVAQERLHVSYAGMTLWEAQDAETRFKYQVLRALDKLAADGVLVRQGAKRDLRFLTPAAAAALDREEAEARRLKEARLDRAKDIAGRLRALDLDVLVSSGVPVRLDPGDWEKLLDLAETAVRPR
jgi:hypothetical protein